MKFTWDKAKDQSNFDKHGIDFELASEIFSQAYVKYKDGRKDYGETRYIAIGKVAAGHMVTVVYTERGEHIRMISARPAHRKERKSYETRSQEDA